MDYEKKKNAVLILVNKKLNVSQKINACIDRGLSLEEIVEIAMIVGHYTDQPTIREFYE